MYTSPVALLSEEISRNKVGIPEGVSWKREGVWINILLTLKRYSWECSLNLYLQIYLKQYYISKRIEFIQGLSTEKESLLITKKLLFVPFVSGFIKFQSLLLNPETRWSILVKDDCFINLFKTNIVVKNISYLYIWLAEYSFRVLRKEDFLGDEL